MKRLILIVMILAILFSFNITAHALESNNVQVVTNGDTTFIIESNGTVKGWGRNQYGEVGIGTTEDQNVPVQIQGLSNIREIVANNYGHGHFFAIDHSGSVYSWGYNGYGLLGLGHSLAQYQPARIDGLPPVSKIVLNGYTTYAITTEGDVYAWGRNEYGQVGNGTKEHQNTPQRLNLSGVKEITAINDVAFALTITGDVYAWGRGDNFQMGNGDWIMAQIMPVQITGLSSVDEVITNGRTSFAICDNRQEVNSWGEGSFNELGTYSARNREPRRVSVLSDLNEAVEELIIEDGTCFAITGDNTLYGWGYNYYNQLANGYTYNVGKPKPIGNLPKIRGFVFTGMTGIALGVDNCVYTWGKNYYGETGTGDKTRGRYATKLNTVPSNIQSIVADNSTVYAIDADGNVYSWGSNYKGQAGLGYQSTIASPTMIPELNGIVGIKNAVRAVYAMNEDGVIYGWGENDYHQSDGESRDNVLLPKVILSNQVTTAMGTGNVDSTVPITGMISALEISITHPANINYSIDPNTQDGFYCADIEIRNNSKVPVKVHVESFEASNSGDIVFQDVLPESMEWSRLNRQDTKSYIALGLQYADESEWLYPQPEFVDAIYAAEIDHSYVGALPKNSLGILRLYGKHGLAFDGSYTANHDLIFVVSLL